MSEEAFGSLMFTVQAVGMCPPVNINAKIAMH